MAYVEMDGHHWPLGDTIGSGGFAQVYESVSPEGEPAVLKLVPKDRGAERELLFEELGDTPNVIPILTTGEYEGHWVLAMPRAEMSLREYLNQQGSLGPDEARAVLADIVTALAALDGRVVHRDLKPENVLCWKGTWCLADFGIARYAEQTTASQTRRDVMTRAYAAPEQWRFERATGATDIYSLGVMAHETLSGMRPFPGPAPEDYREQHLHETAPPLPDVPPGLASIVTSCLMKAPAARPRARNLLTRLPASVTPTGSGATRLQKASLRATQRNAEAAAKAEAERTETERRQALVQDAETALRRVYDALRARLSENAPDAAPVGGSDWPFTLEGARLSWVQFEDVTGADWGQYNPAFEVIAHAGLELRNPPWIAYRGRGHSLWYCDAEQEGVFRWYETAFMPETGSSDVNPDWLPPSPAAGRALSTATLTSIGGPIGGRGVQHSRVALPFTPIDQDDSEAFIDRWLGWFADAAEGLLDPPPSVPIRELWASYRTR